MNEPKVGQELCSGVIPLRSKGKSFQVLLVRHRSGDYWGFPKGHISPNEDRQSAAKRELFEETGLSVIELYDLPPLEE